jgi:uncharacterized repeat protein (TIGR03803 family)
VRTLPQSALTIGLAAAWLAGCAAGNEMPIGAPATSAQASRATTSSFQVLYKFARKDKTGGGQNPANNGLVDVGGTLYGTTANGGLGGDGGNGVVYSISTTGAKKVVYRFGGYQYGDGTRPVDGLIDVKGTLYGTTEYGGHCDAGTVYSLTTAGRETVLHSFCYSSGGNIAGGLVAVKGVLYGTTSSGGTSGDGTVYSLSTSGAYKLIYSFAGGTDGYQPIGDLLDVKGTLYGITSSGGSSSCSYGDGCGTVYSITTSGQEKVLHSFQGPPDGAIPAEGLIDVKGLLYGTTNFGGIAPGSTKGDCQFFGCGTLYSVSTSGTEKVLYRFRGGSHGANPVASLLDMNGTLYGNLSSGGNVCGSGTYHFGCGMIYSMTTGGKNERTVHNFSGSDGATPNDLIDVNDVVYGTTSRGGYTSECNGLGCGTVFTLTP